MLVEIEIYRPESEIPELRYAETTCPTESAEIARRILAEIRQNIIKNWRIETKQDRKDLQNYLSYLHITYGPPVDRTDSGEIDYGGKRR